MHFTANRQAAAQYIPRGFIWQIGLLELAQNESCSVSLLTGCSMYLRQRFTAYAPEPHAARGQPGSHAAIIVIHVCG